MGTPAVVLTWAAWSLLTLGAHAQVRVMSPEWLVKKLSWGSGRIQGATTAFGAPFYGDRVFGRIVYGDDHGTGSHCKGDYEVPPKDTALSGGSTQYEEVRLVNIVVVRRSNCSFTTLVRVASQKGAHAVIIVDKASSPLTANDMPNAIASDDGTGEDIHIPSVFISKEDGASLINAAIRTRVIAELAWDLPANHVVRADLWMSSASTLSMKFLKEFSAKRRILNRVLNFQPHYAVFSLDASDASVRQPIDELCSDGTGKYCAEDPDGAGPITGRDVLDEDVRQLCIHEVSKVRQSAAINPQRDSGGSGDGTHGIKMPPVLAVHYAEKFWAYIEALTDRCPLDARRPEKRFGRTCSESLMQEVGVDVAKVQECVGLTWEKKLHHEREHRAWSPRALRINGWRYSGIMDPDLVTRAICSGFITKPFECQAMIKPRDPFKPFVGSQPAGVTFGTMIMWLFGSVAVAFGLLQIYKRYLKTEIRTTLREEVMLEVQAQMGQYSKLPQNG